MMNDQNESMNKEMHETRSAEQGRHGYGREGFRITEHDVFLCYSPTMQKYIREHGMKYLCSGRDLRSDKIFYVYYKSDMLMDILRRWETIKADLMPEDSSD